MGLKNKINKENPYDPKEFPYCWSGHEYALDIDSGKIMASKYVKGAVARYFKDINNPDADFIFNPEKAERYLRLVQKFEHVIGEWKTKEIIYEPWQNFCWMNIMGFRNKGGTQTRRFRIAHIEVARGNGKSAMASQALLFFLALDDVVQGNHISCVATKKDQARIVLDSARAMAKKSPKFLLEKGVAVREHSIVQKDTNSMAKALSARDDGLDGGAEILAVMDELHAMKRETFDVVYGGMSKRTDSLTLCITTAGFDMESVGFSQSEYAKKLCVGDVEDDQMFAIVYTLDEEDIKNDKNIFNPDYWIKANPSYGASVDPVSFTAKAKKAQVTPADLPTFKVKHLNIWLSEYNSFYDLQKWDACKDEKIKIEDFKNQKCRVGCDVASHIDLNSIGYVFKKEDIYYIFDRSYIPEETVKKIRSSMYENCIGSGHLIQTTGEVVEQAILEDQLIKDKKFFQIQDLLLDPWNSISMMQRLKKERLPITEFRMNVSNLSEPTKKLDQLIRQGKVRHNGSPLLRWCLGNVVVKFDAAGNIFPRKSDERLKIDPIIALLMALASLLQDEAKEKIYADRGLRVL